MHEYSIVTALIDMCETHAKANNATQVAKVKIALGERSGVEKTLVESAFHQFKLDSLYCKDSLLEIDYESVELSCRDCGESFIPAQFEYAQCVYCQSYNVVMTKGRELHLLSLELLTDLESTKDELS